ncbi:uncharacterized protein TNCV_4459241 [Trichonephila clavipes]|nr:uncharacterized protein TNCV_4459241 [Trichonephila clavipes]
MGSNLPKAHERVKINRLGLKEGRFVLGTFRSERMRVLYRSRQNDRLRVMFVLVHIDITLPHTPLPVFRRIGERTIPYSWRAYVEIAEYSSFRITEEHLNHSAVFWVSGRCLQNLGDHDAETVPEPDEVDNEIEVVDLARQINLEVDSDYVQQLLDPHIQEQTMEEFI